MDLSEIDATALPSGREVLQNARSAVVRVWGDGTGTLIMGAEVRPGERYRLRGVRGPGLTLDDALKGVPATGDRRAVPATGPGDVVILERAKLFRGELWCGPVAARMHDGLRGEVQAVLALARPTRLSVHKFGATQFVRLLDPTRARRVSTEADVAEAVRDLLAAPWLGAQPGFLVRNAHKPPGRMEQAELVQSAEIDLMDGEDAARFAERLVRREGLLSGGTDQRPLATGAVELIPTATLPMGREQMMREGGSLLDPAPARVGILSSEYAVRGRLGFVPSFVVVGDEPEFKFKAPTGRWERRCVGLDPRPGVPAVGHGGVATAVRPIGSRERPVPVVAPVYLFKGDEAAKAAEARAARRGPEPDPVPAARPAGQSWGQGRPGQPGQPARTGAPPRVAPPVAPRIASSAPAVRGGLADLADLDGFEVEDGDGPGMH